MNRMLLTRRESLWVFLRVVVVEGEQRGLDVRLYWQPSRLLKDFPTFVEWKCKGLTFKVEKKRGKYIYFLGSEESGTYGCQFVV